MIPQKDITGLVLAGGRGARMGGVDKGLQDFEGQPLAWRAVERLRGQVGALMLNANRNLPDYARLGVPVQADETPDFAGPLAGFMTGLAHCGTPWLVTVPCDTPHFPMDLVQRLARALEGGDARIAMASAPEDDGARRPQPVFCLMHRDLLGSLRDFIADGGRKIDTWTAQHRAVLAPFGAHGDDPRAFFNANTLDELRRLERMPRP